MTSLLARDRNCKDSRLLGAYLDGELDASNLLDVETHLSACETCRERVEVDRATRQSLKRVVRTPDTPQGKAGLSALRARAMTAMLAERNRSEARALESEERGRLLSWRTMVPVASAAALALLWGAASRGPMADSALGTRSDQMRSAFADDFLADMLHEVSNPMPLQFTDPRDVRALDQYVGVSVRPGRFERGGASLLGARVVPVHQHRTALLQYQIGNGAAQQRLSVFIYDPSQIQVSGHGLASREVGAPGNTHRIQVGQANGYSVADTQDRGVGYTVVSDFDADRSAQLAALAMETQ
jgi:anti-sigma factor RsiW